MHIKKAKKLRMVSTGAFCVLGVIGFLGVFPITKTSDTAEATVTPATTTLTMTSSSTTASVDVTPTSSNGTFATSAAADEVAFTVTTNNVTGYNLTIAGSDNTRQLNNTDASATLDSITAATDQATFTTGAAATYSNKWGYKPSMYNSAANTDYLQAPTTTAETLNQTTSANTTADTYTIGLGARVDYTKPVGTYTNTFVIEAVANNVAYQINYLDNSGATVTGLPASEGSSIATASAFTLASGTPSRTGYTFQGWCYGTADYTANPTACTGTTYAAGDNFNFNSYSSTSTNTANLYAMWKLDKLYMQDITSTTCTTTPTTVYDNRDEQSYIIQKLADGKCWMMTNLNLGATTLTTNLTSANTNLSATVTASTFNGWKKSTGSATYTAAEYIPVSGTDSTSRTPYGTLYNYCATSAGTICNSSNSSNASYDICPKGWRLPTGESSGEFKTLYSQSAYNTNAKMRAPIASGGAAFALAGYFVSAAPVDQGSIGYYWSSTQYDRMNMHYLLLGTSSVSPAYNGLRTYGRSIRCVLK